jgi:hypothetical protein
VSVAIFNALKKRFLHQLPRNKCKQFKMWNKTSIEALLLDIEQKYGFDPEIGKHALFLFTKYKLKCGDADYLAAAIACFHISLKYIDDFEIVGLDEWSKMTKYRVTESDIKKYEWKIFETLDYDINPSGM